MGKSNTEKLVEYLIKQGISVTVDNNPSEEKVAEILERLEHTKTINETMIEAYREKAFVCS